MLFRAGLVSRESLDSKSPKLAAQGVGAELGDPAGAHLPAFLPPVPHTLAGRGKGGRNYNARIHWRLFPAFTSPEHPSVPGQGSWTLAGVRGGTHPHCRAVPPPQWEGRRGAAACFGAGGGDSVSYPLSIRTTSDGAVRWHGTMPHVGLHRGQLAMLTSPFLCSSVTVSSPLSDTSCRDRNLGGTCCQGKGNISLLQPGAAQRLSHRSETGPPAFAKCPGVAFLPQPGV